MSEFLMHSWVFLSNPWYSIALLLFGLYFGITLGTPLPAIESIAIFLLVTFRLELAAYLPVSIAQIGVAIIIVWSALYVCMTFFGRLWSHLSFVQLSLDAKQSLARIRPSRVKPHADVDP